MFATIDSLFTAQAIHQSLSDLKYWKSNPCVSIIFKPVDVVEHQANNLNITQDRRTVAFGPYVTHCCCY